MVDNSLLNSAWEKIQNGRGDTLSCYEVDNLRKWAIQKFTPNSEIELEEKIKQLEAENAELHERLKKAAELPVWQENGEAISLFYRGKDGDLQYELYWADVYYDDIRGDKYAKTRFAEILKMEND